MVALFFLILTAGKTAWSGDKCGDFLACTTTCPAGYSCTSGAPTIPCGADSRYSHDGDTACSTCAAGSRTTGGTRITRFACSATECPAGHACNGTSVPTPCGRDDAYAGAGAGRCSTCAAGSRTTGGTGPLSREHCVPCPREPAGACNGTSAHSLPALCRSPPDTPTYSQYSEKLDAADCAAYQDFWDVVGGWGKCDGGYARNDPCGISCSNLHCRDRNGGIGPLRIDSILVDQYHPPAKVGLSLNFLQDISRLAALRKVTVRHIDAVATLPSALGALTGLTDLVLDNNKFFGELPAAWGSLSKLTTLKLHYNELDGSLPPSWKGMVALRILDLQHNRISGILPAAWATLPDIITLTLKNNRIGGAFPAAWAALMRPRPPMAANGVFLDIGHNVITGLMPAELPDAIVASGRSADCSFFRATYNRWMCPFPQNFQQADWSKLCGLDCCPSGQFATYTWNNVFDKCANCTVSTSTAVAANCGQCGCSACTLGQFGVVANASTCTVCPAGKYSADVTGALMCGGCDRGQFASAGSATCSPCSRGQFAELTEVAKCSPCPPNTYQDEYGQVACKSCALHNRSKPTTNGAHGADSPALCIAAESDSRPTCPPGQSAAAGGGGCTLCSPGRFKAHLSKEPCNQCPCGVFSAAGATKCDVVCAAGFFGNVSSATCDPCPPAHFCVEGRAQPNTDAKVCSAGQSIARDVSALTDRVCVKCAAGHFSDEPNSLTCSACTAGKSQPGTGQVACIDCSPGTYQNGTGARACAPCPEGRFASSTSASRCESCAETRCESGTRVGCGGVSAGVCVNQCPAGTFLLNATRACGVCPSGFYCLGGLKLKCGSAAVFCPGGSDRPTVADTRKCTVGSKNVHSCSLSLSAPSSTMVAQRNCSAGHYCEGGRMKVCERGFSCSGGKRTPCHEPGTFCPGTGLTTAVVCPPGYACTSEGVARRCERNEFSEVGRCTRCGHGEFVRENRCMRCPTPLTAASGPWVVRCVSGFAQLEDENFFCAACLQEQQGVRGGNLHLDHVALHSANSFIRCPQMGVCKLAINASDYRVSMRCAGGYTGALCGVCAAGHGRAGSSCVPCPAGWVIPSCSGIGAAVFFAAFISCVRAAFRAGATNRISRHLTTTSMSILLSFLFETSLLASYQLDWGQTLRVLFGISSAAATGDVTSVALTACIGLDLHSKMKFVFCAPFFVVLLPLPVLCFMRKRGSKQIWGAPIARVYQTAVIISLWLIHPAILRECLLALSETQVGDEAYVAADLSVNVSDPKYVLTKTLAIVMMCTFVPFWPLSVFVAMYRHRRHLRVDDTGGLIPLSVRQRYVFFYGGFRAQYWWWEFVNFIFKIALTMVSTEAELEPQPAKLLFFATGVVLAYCMADLKYAPYKRSLEVRLVRITNFALLGLMFAAQGLNVGLLTGDEGFQHVTRLLAGAGTISVIAIFLLVFTHQVWHRYCGVSLSLLGSSRNDGGSDGEGDDSGGTNASFRQTNPMNPMLKVNLAESASVESVERPSELVKVEQQPTTRARHAESVI